MVIGVGSDSRSECDVFVGVVVGAVVGDVFGMFVLFLL